MRSPASDRLEAFTNATRVFERVVRLAIAAAQWSVYDATKNHVHIENEASGAGVVRAGSIKGCASSYCREVSRYGRE